MKNSKLWQALETLSSEERHRFALFVQSPYFNSQPMVTAFFDAFAERCWQKGLPPDKAALHQQLYPALPYDDHRIRLLMSKLFKLLEVFWKVEKSDTEMPWSVPQAYRQRQLPKHFEQALRQAQRQLSTSPERSSRYFLDQYLLADETYRQRAQEKRTSSLNLHEADQYLNIFYCIAKLRQACLAKSHQFVFPTDYEIALLEELLQHLRGNPLLQEPAVAAYYHSYHYLHESSDAARHFDAFLDLISGPKLAVFPAEELQDMFLLALNFCTRQYNLGSSAYLQAQLQLYKLGLEKGLLLQQGQLSPFTYRNITTLGLILEDYEWVDNFLEHYRAAMPVNRADQMYHFCKARLEYAKGKYGAALQRLNEVHFGEPLLQLSVRTVRLKLFYETSAFDVLEARMHALEKFIRRKKALSYHRENYLNLLHFLRQLQELPPGEKNAREALADEIKACPNVAERTWLLRQLST
ncbi:MAG: hypothetical protein RIC19_05810 [Phaeodactylibacter sp.]|uniref:hypothetical protein n=1 Tax=Phaeodactylibacter sp. TaxID=1940289 RepID=UPI0032F06BAB